MTAPRRSLQPIQHPILPLQLRTNPFNEHKLSGHIAHACSNATSMIERNVRRRRHKLGELIVAISRDQDVKRAARGPAHEHACAVVRVGRGREETYVGTCS